MVIRGTVNARLESIVAVRVRGPSGAEQALSAVVDTGFTGWLTVPPELASSLGLVQRPARNAKLGDGTVRPLNLYDLEVEWGGAWHLVEAYATGREPLIGMRLLAGHRLTVDVVPGGAVAVTPLAAAPGGP